MAIEKLPIEYRQVHLYDELKYLALRERLNDAQRNQAPNSIELLKLSTKMNEILQAAEIKRTAFYSKESVQAFFGIQGHLRKQGRIGRFLAYIINPSSYSKYFK